MAKMVGPYTYYWNEESFGNKCPENWEDIASAVNSHLDDFQEANNADEDEMWNHSAYLWDWFCENDEVCGVTAEW